MPNTFAIARKLQVFRRTALNFWCIFCILQLEIGHRVPKPPDKGLKPVERDKSGMPGSAVKQEENFLKKCSLTY
jgi:hypothetical protein